MGGRAGRAENGNRQGVACAGEGLRREERRRDGDFGSTVGKLRDDAEFVVAGIRAGRDGFAVSVVVAGAGRGGGGRVVRGVFGGVEKGVPLRARGENGQQQDQRCARQRGEAREEGERGVVT